MGKLGQDEGPNRGPKPGEGATISNPAAGNSDMEGTPGDVLPDYRGQAASDKPLEESNKQNGDPAEQSGGRLPNQPSGKTPQNAGH